MLYLLEPIESDVIDINEISRNPNSFSMRELNTTVFPDGTSQVWQLGTINPTYHGEDSSVLVVYWDFECESEVFQFLQLQRLILSISDEIKIHLVCPYLPYARQDKPVGDDQCFALDVLFSCLGQNSRLCIDRIVTFDVHNPARVRQLCRDYVPELFDYGNRLVNISPDIEIRDFASSINPDLIVFPDKGAMERYKDIFGIFELDTLFFEKVRDQQTGNITSLRPSKEIPPHNTALVIDDICDGGRTFVEVAKFLGKSVKHLYVSHGLFSAENGVQKLHDAGYKSVACKTINKKLSKRSKTKPTNITGPVFTEANYFIF